MRISSIENAITKIGVYSLAVLAVIGIIASFVSLCEMDLSAFSGTVAESIFFFILIVLSIFVGFCFPASFLINVSRIAAASRSTNDDVY